LVNGLVGIVLETNYRYRHLPRIIVVKDLQQTLEKEQILNLADVEQKKLDKTYLIKRALRDGTHDIHLRDYREKGLTYTYG
jgi:hypothetical protein